MKNLGLIAFVILILFCQSLFGAISIPSNLSDNDQGVLLQYLGFGTAFRAVNNPSPLGLYSGIEFGLSLEDIPTADIGYLGSGASDERSLVYPTFSFGKGIFDNLDLFFEFTPYLAGTGVGIYGGGLRWGFFQATFVPALFSLLISATGTNIDNLFSAQTEGIDLISGINMDPLSFYIGAGTLYGQGQFDPSLTIEKSSTNVVARSFHSTIGVSLTVSKVFAALEIDNYSTTTFSFKLGGRL